MSEEQNYSFIDGRINNLPKPRIIGGRASALDRLHIKQAEMAIRDGKPVPQHYPKPERRAKQEMKKRDIWLNKTVGLGVFFDGKMRKLHVNFS